jgi:hypothetical protein
VGYKYKPGGIVGAPYKLIGHPGQGTHTLGNWQSDNAVDLSIPVGTLVYAVADGVIGGNVGSTGKGGRFAGSRFTLIAKGNRFWYGHLSKLKVKKGQRVKWGQLVGYSGSANGVPHLHFAAEHGNPADYLGGFKQSKGQPAPQPAAEPPAEQEEDFAPQSLTAPPTTPGVPSADQALPGSVDIPYEPRQKAETWRLLSADPLAPPEARKIAQGLSHLVDDGGA